MDTAIEPEVIKARKIRTYIFIGLAIVALIAVVMLVRASIKSSVKSSEITTGTVEIGNIENTISATGEILPEFFEGIITSPINASLQSATTDVGSPVNEGVYSYPR